jgi:hypothetical protein
MMSDFATLLALCRELGAVLSLKHRLPTAAVLSLSHEVSEGQKRPEQETSAWLPHGQGEGTQLLLTTEACAFLEQYVPRAVLEVFPEWHGVLVTVGAAARPVWIVRDRQDGRRLAEETGQPALLLDDVLAQGGQGDEEAWQALVPLLIPPEGRQ